MLPVAVALLIAALTPLGDGVRELLFPTHAALSGSVTIGGRPVEGAVVSLDGEDAGRTDRGGAYLLTGVGDGSHVVTARAAGTYPGEVAIAVQRGANEVKANPLELRPLVELGYTITSLDLLPSGRTASTGGFVLTYDFTLWIYGDAAAMGRVTAVTYALPAPFTSSPVASSGVAFCFRQSGGLSFDRMLGSPGLGAVSATVALDDGTSFPITGQAGDRPPPTCQAKRAGTEQLPDTQSPTTPPNGQGPPPPPPPPAPPPPNPTPAPKPTPTPSPTPTSGPRILSFEADTVCGEASTSGGSVTLRYDVRDADTISIVMDGHDRVVYGALFKMPTSTSLSYPCDGQPHIYELTVLDTDGRSGEPRTVTVSG